MPPNRSSDWAPVSPPSTSNDEIGATGGTGVEREHGETLLNVAGKEEGRFNLMLPSMKRSSNYLECKEEEEAGRQFNRNILA